MFSHEIFSNKRVSRIGLSQFLVLEKSRRLQFALSVKMWICIELLIHSLIHLVVKILRTGRFLLYDNTTTSLIIWILMLIVRIEKERSLVLSISDFVILILISRVSIFEQMGKLGGLESEGL